VPAGLAKRKRGPRAATGLHSQALGPAARSWLTGVAGPRTESVARTPEDTAVARRKAPACSERTCGTRQECRADWRATPSASCRGSTPPDPLWPGRKGKAGSPGAVQTTRAISHGWFNDASDRGRRLHILRSLPRKRGSAPSQRWAPLSRGQRKSTSRHAWREWQGGGGSGSGLCGSAKIRRAIRKRLPQFRPDRCYIGAQGCWSSSNR
jgi:hypothetical protein